MGDGGAKEVFVRKRVGRKEIRRTAEAGSVVIGAR
jgi:hypothetical protein